ncbi:MAG: sugar transferase [Bdellovibrionaceae bacterium]|nr:sugar transferase [Pseudobdellovibrionaceae bacterium]
MGKRVFDILLGLALSIVLLPVILMVGLAVNLSSKGPVIHWSKRMGRNNKIFLMPKFRSMRTDAPQVATHLLAGSQNYVTRVGVFLRKTSLDELPQLWSVLVGDMSFVGPRPALFNQDDLVELRTRHGIERLRPGITGWAQINGRDDISIPVKVQLDKEYLEKKSLWFDVKIILLTFVKVFRAEGIRH